MKELYPPKPDFYRFNGMGRADEGSVDDRTVCSERLPQELMLDLMEGKLLTEWPSDAMALLETPHLHDDLLWTDQYIHVCSDRLRELLEEVVPGHAQYLPISIVRNQRMVARYWVANWLNIVDCANTALSTLKKEEVAPGQTLVYYAPFILDPSRVPAPINICRVRHKELDTIIRSKVRSILDEKGMRGCQYYPIAQSVRKGN